MSSRTSAARRPGGPAARRFLAYQLAGWGLLALVAWSAHPLAALALLAVALWTTLPLLAFVRNGGGWRRYPTAAFRLLVVRPVLYAQLLLPIVGGAAVLGLVGGAVAGAPLAGARWTALAALAVGGTILAAGWAGSRRLVVREVEAVVPDLPAAFDGLRIVQLSDLHVGPHTSRAFLERVTRAAWSLRPDVVVVTGDLVDDRAEDVAHFAEVVDRLAAPLGVWLIPGNHDVYAGWPAVEAALRARTGAHVLVNEARVLTRDGAALALLGTGDPAGARDGEAAPDVARAWRGVPDGAPVVAFAHNPALWPALAQRGAALTLSGHTHWGQLALPGRGWSLASPFNEHAMGGYQKGSALLFVHPGTGFWGIPFRLGADPEVTAITLRRGEAAGLALGATRRAA